MPLEINELEIITTIKDPDEANVSSGSDLKEEIIQECIDKIMQILKDKQEL